MLLFIYAVVIRGQISNQSSLPFPQAVLFLIDLFNLIEFFGFAAIFGWLAFARLNDEEITKIRTRPHEGKDTREERQARAKANLYALGNYFLIAFLCYSIAGISDYLYWHTHHQLGVFLTQDVMFAVTLTSFFFATLILPVPFIEGKSAINHFRYATLLYG